MRDSDTIAASAVAVLVGCWLIGALGAAARAEAQGEDVSALACTAAYQLDWQATTSPERSAADRDGAEKTYEALRAGASPDTAGEISEAVTRQTAELEARIGSDGASLTEIVEACDLAWSGEASDYAAQYAPPPAPSTSTNTDITTFENTEPTYSTPAPAQSAECDTAERRATGIINTWTYALEDYFAGGVRDYDQERELSDLYGRLRSRLEDELTVAEFKACDSLADDIRYVLGDWDNPF